MEVRNNTLHCNASLIDAEEFITLNIINTCTNINCIDLCKAELTNQHLKSLEKLPHDTLNNIETLILDNNNLTSLENLPLMKSLKTLWVNKNNIVSLDQLLTLVSVKFPSLSYLSLLWNPCAPSELNGATNAEQTRYRARVLYFLPQLRLLDATPFSQEEMEYINKKGQFYYSNHSENSNKYGPMRPDGSSWATKPNISEINYFNTNPHFIEKMNHVKVKKPYYKQIKLFYDDRNSEGNRFITDDIL